MTSLFPTSEYCGQGTHWDCIKKDCSCVCHLSAVQLYIEEPEHPQARNTDPPTSHESARLSKDLGLQTQIYQTLTMVRDNPNKTAGELARIFADLTGEPDSRTIPRFLRHLERIGLIHESGKRKDLFTNRNCIEWAPGPRTEV